jgi:hypothetical protein
VTYTETIRWRAAPEVHDRKAFSAVMEKAATGDKAALAQIIAWTDASPTGPQAWAALGDLAQRAQSVWMDVSAGPNPVHREAIGRVVAGLRATLLGADPSPLERLLVERIIVCWLQVNQADRVAGVAAAGSSSLELDTHNQQRQDRAHQRFLAAVKALAVVRRLLTPTVQVNRVERQINLTGSAREPDELHGDAHQFPRSYRGRPSRSHAKEANVRTTIGG